jgi:Domain of unknown function (DUF222)
MFWYADEVSAQSPAPAPWQLPEEELATEVLACEENLRREHARMLTLVAEAEQRGLGAALGYRNTVTWLGSALRLSTREAKLRVEQATAIMPRVTACGGKPHCELRATGQALAAGEINRGHVAEIQRVFAQYPKEIEAAQRGETQETLLELARQAKPEALRQVARRILHYWEMEKPPTGKPEAPSRCREFHYSYDRDGWMRFTGVADPETGATLEGQFVALAAPRGKNLDGTPDERSTAERQGDALAEIIALAARADEASIQGGEKAVLFLIVTVDEMEQRLRDSILDIPGLRDAGDIRKLACEAGVIPAVFSAEGEPLYLGRESRFATLAQRRALALRDKGCTAPGVLHPHTQMDPRPPRELVFPQRQHQHRRTRPCLHPAPSRDPQLRLDPPHHQQPGLVGPSGLARPSPKTPPQHRTHPRPTHPPHRHELSREAVIRLRRLHKLRLRGTRPGRRPPEVRPIAPETHRNPGQSPQEGNWAIEPKITQRRLIDMSTL